LPERYSGFLSGKIKNINSCTRSAVISIKKYCSTKNHKSAVFGSLSGRSQSTGIKEYGEVRNGFLLAVAATY
jgi:hypothetical protein